MSGITHGVHDAATPQPLYSAVQTPEASFTHLPVYGLVPSAQAMAGIPQAHEVLEVPQPVYSATHAPAEST
jgi:hypothetical protein